MIRFEKETHQYFDNDIELISVTRLMAKHGLAPDYSGVSRAVLGRKAARGTLIHEEIEAWIKRGEIGFTEEVASFVEYVKDNFIIPSGSEVIVYNDICAGTVDLFMIDAYGKRWIADIKTTERIHEDAVAWQLSIYNALSDRDADIFAVFHFDREGRLTVRELKPKPKEEVERLFQCEREGRPFVPNVPYIIEDALLEELSDFEMIIKQADAQKKAAEEQAKAIKDAILRAMEQNGISTFEQNGIRLTVVAGGEKTQLDTARLKDEMPDVAKKYAKKVKTAPYLRVTIKEGADE